MKILIVEDEIAAAEGILEDISRVSGRIRTSHVTSRDEAIAAIDADEFDLLICDLFIPPQSGGLDLSVRHGVAVYDHAMSIAPGMPAIFLTGQGDYREVRDQLAGRGSSDLFGNNRTIPMGELFFKNEREKYMAYIATLAEGLSELEDAVTLEITGASTPLTISEERLLRIYARPLNASRILLKELSGLSGMRSLHLHLLDSTGAHLAWTFGKLGDTVSIMEEKQRYDAVAPRLRPGDFAPMVSYIPHGARKSGGLFYTLADDYPYSALQWFEQNPSDACEFIDRIRAIVDDWQEAQQANRISIGAMRRAQIGDESVAPFGKELESVKWQEVESTEIEINHSMQHGDLHGFNILVDKLGRPILIDFGSSGYSACCLDPIVLELSILFHEQSPFRGGSWPSPEQCEVWDQVEDFVIDSQLREVLLKTRSWGIEVSNSPQAFYATAYCQVMRQLKYQDTDKARTLSIARACVRRLSVLLAL